MNLNNIILCKIQMLLKFVFPVSLPLPAVFVILSRASGFGGMVEYWNGGKTTPTNYGVSRPFPISFICHGPRNQQSMKTQVQSS